MSLSILPYSVHSPSMISQVYWIDGHIDLASIAVRGRDVLKQSTNPQEACISIPDLVESPIRTFFGTIYTTFTNGSFGFSSSDDRDGAHRAGLEQLTVYDRLANDGHLTKQMNGLNIGDQLSMLLVMEGADPIRNPDEVKWWREQGLRAVGLTWSDGTRYAGGNRSLGPITEEGKELVSALDESGIVHDVSHLADEGVEQLFTLAKGPIIASHSNSRLLLNTESQRNLHDDHAKELLSRGGVIGLNLCTQFLAEPFDRETHTATIQDCITHVLHFCSIAGNNYQIALGSDFDGGFTPKYLPIGIKHPSALNVLASALKEAGFTEDELKSFAHGAWQRVFNSVEC